MLVKPTEKTEDINRNVNNAKLIHVRVREICNKVNSK